MNNEQGKKDERAKKRQQRKRNAAQEVKQR